MNEKVPSHEDFQVEYLNLPYACFPCRRSFKRRIAVAELPDSLTCPHCGSAAVRLSHKFKAPRQSDIEQWQKVEALVAAGFRFGSAGNYEPYPEKLRDVEAFVRRHRDKS